MNEYISIAVMSIMAFAILLSTYRLLRGPTASDRVVALDALTNMTTSIIALIALLSGRFIYLDVALVYAILSFAGVIVAARYLEGGI